MKRGPAFLLMAICLLAPAARADVSAGYLSDYESGHRALRYSSWDEAVFWFQSAVDKQPRDGGPPGRVSGRNYVAYLPHYYLGLALYQGGRYSEALAVWDETEKRWDSEDWLKGSKGLLEVRQTLDSYRGRYEKSVMPKALGELSGYLEEMRATIADLKQEIGKGGIKPEVAAEVKAAEERLGSWDQRAAAPGASYREILALTKEIAQTLDRLEVLQGCAGPEAAAQPWCRRQAGMAPGLRRVAADCTTDPSYPGICLRSQDLTVVNQLYAKKYALLISPSYSKWEPIPEAAPKLVQLNSALTALGFTVKVLPQTLSKDDIENAVRDFIDSNAPLIADRPNLLLIHFIGHGYSVTSRGDKIGLLVTSSTPAPTADAAAIAKQAVFEGFFRQFLPRPLHHIAFTFETCSSGKFLEELSGANPKDWRKCISSPAFLVLTAGDIDEVGSLKKLPLTEELIRTFNGCGQAGKTAVWSGYLLFDGVQRRLMQQYRNRNPQFRKYLLDDHREGDFLLTIPDRCSKS